ncbi:MAG TPA: DUF6597 domain-containing transcriptional factor, partial [Gemmatimonadales bacterium]|nr:DUF6597 domain-containing transcriptional factor [Gemmatimonadales bacterium]
MSGTLDARPVAPRYREYRPHPALAPWVRCYWTIAAEDAAPTPNRICPDGCADIIVDLGAPAPPVGRTGGLRAYAVGTMRSPVVVPMSGRIDMIGIRFRPGGARAFLGVPLVQLTDRTAPLEALGWRGVAILEEQLAESAEPAVRLSRLEEALSCRRPRTRARAGAGTPGAIDLLERTHGALSIRDVTRATGLSGRALERAFRDAVGVSPKRFARIVR